MQKRHAFTRSFDSAIEQLLMAATQLDETSAQRTLWKLSRSLRSFEYDQLERSDRERDFSQIRDLRESKRQRKKRRKHAREGLSSR